MAELHGKRVLVADDDDLVRLVIVEEFECAGCIVTEAAASAQALDRLKGDTFDLLVTDIRMPDFDGWTLAERARELHPGLPILYVTGWSDEAPRPVVGGTVLGKPFHGDELVPTAARLIESHNG